MKGTCFILTVPIYETWLLVSIGQSEADFSTIFRKHFPNLKPGSFDNKSGGTYLDQYGDPICLRVRKSLSSPDGKATLNHELFHIVCRMLSYRGMTHCSESEEAYTYLISYLTREIYEGIGRKN